MLCHRAVAEDKKQQRQRQASISSHLASRPLLHDACLYSLQRWRHWPTSQAFYTWLGKAREHQNLRQNATVAIFSYAGTFVGPRVLEETTFLTGDEGKRHKGTKATVYLLYLICLFAPSEAGWKWQAPYLYLWSSGVVDLSYLQQHP